MSDRGSHFEFVRLDITSAAPFRELVPAYHRPDLRRLDRKGLVAVGAWEADGSDRVPVGIAMAVITPGGAMARILFHEVRDHAQVGANGRGVSDHPSAPPAEEVPAGLFRSLAEAARAQGCVQLVRIHGPAGGGTGLARSLTAAGFVERPLLRVVGDVTRFTPPWVDRVRVPRAFEVTPWAALPTDTCEEILGRARTQPGYPDQPPEPNTSQALLRDGRVVGWNLNFRPRPTHLVYEALEVEASFASTGVALALLAEAVRRQLSALPEVRTIEFENHVANRSMLRILDRYWIPYFVEFEAARGSEWVRWLAHDRAMANEPATMPDAEDEPGENMLWSRAYTCESSFQHIAMRWNRRGFYLELDGFLQFHSAEEHRYHEALAHPPLLSHGEPRSVLILGGGDGLALREVLRYPSVERAVLVDIDPDMTALSSRFPPLAELNRHAFDDPRVQVMNEDASAWIERYEGDPFDVVLVDFPNPNTPEHAALYSTELFGQARAMMTARGALSIQSTSLFHTPEAFWCIARTLAEAGFFPRPYHVASPSFGLWGFVLATLEPRPAPVAVPFELRYIDRDTLPALFALGQDLGPLDALPNTTANAVLSRVYEEARARPLTFRR